MVASFYRNIRLLILTIVLIAVWGLSAYQALPRQEDPELVSRVAVVKTLFPGASAERVEALVTEVIESEISEIEEIETVESESRVGFSTVSIELYDSVSDAAPIWSRVRDELADAAQQFPPGALEPELEEVEVKAYAAIAALTWTQDTLPNYAILRRFAKELDIELRNVNGTEDLEVFGFPDEEIVVEIDAPNLAAVGLTAQQLSQQIDHSDAKVTAGQLRSSQNNLAIEVDSELESLERIRQIPIQSSVTGQFARLGDIARVQRGIRQPQRGLAIVSGQPAVAVGVLMESGRRIDQWAEAMHQKLDAFRDRLPTGIELDVIFDQSQYVQVRLDELMSNLLFGALLVVVVTFVGMGWRSSLIVGTALPLTVFAVFGVMQAAKIPIHQMSVSGLIIALGLLIDNAIVVVDEIQVEIHKGHKPLDAVVKTVNYLKVPLLASSLTTILTFLPIALLPGGSGEFVGSIAMTVIVSLVASLVLSLTVIAGLAGRLLGGKSTARNEQQLDSPVHSLSVSLQPGNDQELPTRHRRHKGAGNTNIFRSTRSFLSSPNAWWNAGFSSPRLGRLYRWSLEQTAAKPIFAIVLTLVLPIVGFVKAGSLPEQFFPALDRDQFQIEVEFPAQTAIAQSHTQVLRARELIRQHPQVKDVHWFVGESAPKFFYNIGGVRENAPYYAQAIVQLTTAQKVPELIHTLQNELDTAFPNARVLVRQLEQGPPFDAPVELRIYGSDMEQLRTLGAEARAILTRVPDVVNTRDDLTEALPKLELKVDEEQAQLAGLSNAAIAQQLEATLEGAVGGSILEATENLSVRVRVTNDRRGDLSQIASLNLQPTQPNPASGQNFRSLAALGSFDIVPQLAKISRRNEQRVNTVQGFITAGVLPSGVLENFQKRLKEEGFELPPGYWYEFGGEQAERNEALSKLVAFVGLIGIAMVMTLVLSLSSFKQAGIVAIVGVATIGMALFSLWLFGSVRGFMAIVGTMGLVGIGINGGIIVLSAFNEDPKASQGDRKAVCDVTVKATRHVLTTTITTMVGFIPLIASGGSFWRPLAIAIAGGIAISPFLALYLTPAAYLMLKRRSKRSLVGSH